MLDQFGQVGGDASQYKLHPAKTIGEVLDQFGNISTERALHRAIKFIEDDQHPSASQLGAQIAELAR